MASVNKVIIVGNLGRDPEVRYTPNGSAVCNVTIATSRVRKNKESGDKSEDTEWHRVVFFDKLAEIAGEYLKKGRSVYVEGRLQTRKWTDKDGHEKYSTEVVLQGFNSQLTMLDRAGSGSSDHGSDDSNADFGSSGPAPRARQPAMAGATKRGDPDDEIPF